jgi:hypothetical protein
MKSGGQLNCILNEILSLFALVKRCLSRFFLYDGYRGESNLSPLTLEVALE